MGELSKSKFLFLVYIYSHFVNFHVVDLDPALMPDLFSASQFLTFGLSIMIFALFEA